MQPRANCSISHTKSHSENFPTIWMAFAYVLLLSHLSGGSCFIIVQSKIKCRTILELERTNTFVTGSKKDFLVTWRQRCSETFQTFPGGGTDDLKLSLWCTTSFNLIHFLILINRSLCTQELLTQCSEQAEAILILSDLHFLHTNNLSFNHLWMA